MFDLRTPIDRFAPWIALGIFILAACAYGVGVIDITSINQLGRYIGVAVVALGVDLIWGYAGILTLFQAMFFCFGGYALGMYLAMHGPLDGDHHDIPRCLFVVSSVVSGMELPWFWKPFGSLPVAILLGLLLPGLAAFAYGWFTFRSRVRGVYFSIITQATTVAVWLIFCQNSILLCGTNGLTNFTNIAGFDLNLPAVKFGMFAVSAVVLIVVWLLCRALVRSRAGRLLVAVRDNEVRLRFAGYDPAAFKVFVFTVGGMLAALGGMLYSPQNGIITPSNMDFTESTIMVVCVAVGGRGTLTGAVIGAFAVYYLKAYLTSHFPEAWEYILGALFISVVLFFPAGLYGLIPGPGARKVGGGGGDEDEGEEGETGTPVVTPGAPAVVAGAAT
jgi:urea transport system permease protein